MNIPITTILTSADDIIALIERLSGLYDAIVSLGPPPSPEQIKATKARMAAAEAKWKTALEKGGE